MQVNSSRFTADRTILMIFAVMPGEHIIEVIQKKTCVIELDDGKALYLMVKTMVSCRFSHQPIHWMCFQGCVGCFKIPCPEPFPSTQCGQDVAGSWTPCARVFNGSESFWGGLHCYIIHIYIHIHHFNPQHMSFFVGYVYVYNLCIYICKLYIIYIT